MNSQVLNSAGSDMIEAVQPIQWRKKMFAKFRESALKITLIISILVAILMASFYVIKFHGKTLTEYAFFTALRQTKNSNADFVFIKALTNFTWDTVCILSPYSVTKNTNRERIQKYVQADVTKHDLNLLNLDQDGKWAFIFIHEHQIVHIIRTHGEFAFMELYTSNCINQKDALFRFQPDDVVLISDGRK